MLVALEFLMLEQVVIARNNSVGPKKQSSNEQNTQISLSRHMKFTLLD